MPPATFLVVEAVAFLFAALVLREAWREGAADFATMVVAMGFGFAIELFFVTQYAGYSYGDFLFDFPVMGHYVPLWVAAGWGTIIYIAMKASDRMGLPWATRPALDGLLALSLDLTLDPVAEALGWWSWSRAGQAWGVPFDNFIGWMLIVSSFSFFTRAGYRALAKHGLWKDILVPVVALVPSVLAVAGAQIALEKVYPVLGEPKTWLIVAAALALICVPQVLKAKASEARAWYLTWVPISYHGLMVGLLLATPLSEAHPELILFMLAAAIASIAGFRYPNP